MSLRTVRIPAAALSRRFSGGMASEIPAVEKSPATKSDGVSRRETLRTRLLRLNLPKRSVEAYQAASGLRKLGRYRHALQVCEWKTKQKDIKLQTGDYALHLDLIAKVHGVRKAENFFNEIPSAMAKHSVYSALLHSYVKCNMLSKAETLMAKMLESGLIKNCLPYNNMLSLYMANDQLEKVPEMIQELKRHTSPDVVTYNMWLTFCVKRNDVQTAEEVFSELKEAKLKPDWVTHSALTNLYMKNGLKEKAADALKEVKKFASRTNRVIFSSLISLHRDFGDKDGVLGVWRKMKLLFGKLNDDEYTLTVSSLLKLEELKEAEDLYADWESVFGSKDSRVPNLLLAAYINRNKMEMAEEFYERMTQSGIKASYTTFELLTYGYVKQRKVEKALHNFESALKSVAKWNPAEKLVGEMFNVIKEEGCFEGAEKLLNVLRSVGYVTTGIYNSVLRTYAQAGKMPLLIEERMKKDKLKMDEETQDLIKITSKMCISEVPSAVLNPPKR